MHLKKITECRLCKSNELEEILNLGSQNLHGSFIYPNKLPPPNRKIPLSVLRCCPDKNQNACGLVQLSHSVPPEILYDDYGYRTKTTQKMINHMGSVVDKSLNYLGKERKNSNLRVLDIACNDTTLLQQFPDYVNRVGIDPSSAIDDAPKFNSTLKTIKDFFPSKTLDEYITHNNRKIKDERIDKFDQIFILAMFYDLENPTYVLKRIKEMLKDDGILTIEFGYLVSVLENLAFDYFCQEHLCLYSLATFEYLLKLSGLKIFDVFTNDINGGSVQCWITHKENHIFDTVDGKDRLKQLRFKEFDLELDTEKPYYNFGVKFSSCYKYVKDFISEEVRGGKKIHLYGSSTKSNLLIQTFGFSNKEIPFASDRLSFKDGASTLGSGIKIISEQKSRDANPDYYLCFIYFREEVLQREKEYFDKGGKMIFVLPNFQIVGKDGVEFEYKY